MAFLLAFSLLSPLLYDMEGNDGFICPRCGNEDPIYIGNKNGMPYCRRCISFRGEEVTYRKKEPKEATLNLHYSLSQEQASISESLLKNYENGIESLVYAVCGAGKTEISFALMADCIRKGLTVGFALPRRDVVIELYWRLKEAFPLNDVIAVYGGHNEKLEGDIIVLTTHQLYRYQNYFDLLVMDEIDAFPFKGNDTLISFFKRSVRGHSVLMSATPSDAILKEYKQEGHSILELRTRFHKKEIPVPEVKLMPSLFSLFYLAKKLNEYKKAWKPCFVFAPTIARCEILYRLLSLFIKGGNYVHSKRDDREGIIKRFKDGEYSFLVTTSVLERGVTVKNLQVIVYGSDDESIYDSSTLIQIAGRVGRKMDASSGEVIFLASKETQAIRKAIDEIKFCNTFL